MFDDNAASLGTFEYTPFGGEYTDGGPDKVWHRFTGLDLDPLTGQYYAPYRYYDPTSARWLTRDPLGMVDGPNVYGYVGNVPTRFNDALGLLPQLVIQCGVGAAIGVSLLILGWAFVGAPESMWGKICEIAVAALFGCLAGLAIGRVIKLFGKVMEGLLNAVIKLQDKFPGMKNVLEKVGDLILKSYAPIKKYIEGVTGGGIRRTGLAAAIGCRAASSACSKK